MVTQEKYLIPYTSFGFEKLFGKEENKDLLINFLNQLITGHGLIKNLTFLSAEQLYRSKYELSSIYDVYCESEKGEKFIVEIQRAELDRFEDRNHYYSSFPIQKEKELGGWSSGFKAVYCVGILDFVFYENKNNDDFFHQEVKLADKEVQKVFYDKLTHIYLEMPKFKKKETELETLFDKWLYVLNSLQSFQKRPKILGEQIFKKLFQIAELANFTPEETYFYERSLKVYRDNYAVMETARRKREETGFKKGKTKGFEENFKKGFEEGKAEKKLEIAKNFIKMGFSISDIAKGIGLSEEEIIELQN